MNYDELYDKAIEKIGEGEYEEAIKYLDEAIKEKDDVKAWVAKATVLIALKRGEEAIQILDNILAMNENDDFLIALKGITLYEMGKDGRKYLERALEINPKNSSALYWKGVMEGKAGRKEEEARLKGKSAFILFAYGGDMGAVETFREVYYLGVDIPIRYECGIAYAAIISYTIPFMSREERQEFIEETDSIIEDCWEHRDIICKSARAMLNEMVGEEPEEFIVNDEKDFVFEKLLEVEYGEEEEN